MKTRKFILKKKPKQVMPPIQARKPGKPALKDKKKQVWLNREWREKARACEAYLVELLQKGAFEVSLDGSEPSLTSLSEQFGIARQEVRQLVLRSMSDKELIWIKTVKTPGEPNKFLIQPIDKRREKFIKRFTPYGGIFLDPPPEKKNKE